jgi:hypothetical protein
VRSRRRLKVTLRPPLCEKVRERKRSPAACAATASLPLILVASRAETEGVCWSAFDHSPRKGVEA